MPCAPHLLCCWCLLPSVAHHLPGQPLPPGSPLQGWTLPWIPRWDSSEHLVNALLYTLPVTQNHPTFQFTPGFDRCFLKSCVFSCIFYFFFWSKWDFKKLIWPRWVLVVTCKVFVVECWIFGCGPWAPERGSSAVVTCRPGCPATCGILAPRPGIRRIPCV